MPNHKLPKILVIGASGQIGWEVVRAMAPLGPVYPLTRSEVDLTDLAALRSFVRSIRPDVIVNAAADTRVDAAEIQDGQAIRLNAEMPEVLAIEAEGLDALLVHYSTDYVFDGAERMAYTERDVPHPQTKYGQTKLAGDRAILESRARSLIFRVGWVYGLRRKNFLLTVRQLARENPELRVVAEQSGAPTWSRAIAECTALAIGQHPHQRRSGATLPVGVFHMASPDYTTWHEFAMEIVAGLPREDGWIPPRVVPIATADYQTAATRPPWSVLDSTRLREVFGLSLPPWREQLRLCLNEG